ncbi:MAG: efflux RND transporter permease subunit [Flavobacteriales bacterium]
MLNKCIKFLIYNPIIAGIVLLFCLIWGLSNSPFQHPFEDYIPKQSVALDALPDLGENQQIIFTKWDGKSPQNIEDQITYPLTSTLLGLPKVKTIRANSMFGVSSIYIIFEDDVDVYWSRSRVLEKLNAIPKNLLPKGVQPSLGPAASGLGQVFWYTLEARDEHGNPTGFWDLEERRQIQDELVKPALQSSKDVAEVASIGGFVKEYQVDIKPERLKQYNLSLQDVAKAIRNSNVEIGAQTIEINQVEYLVRGLGYIKSASDLENAVLSSSEFKSVRLKDVAHISFGPAARRGILDKSGAEAVGGVVLARYGSNAMEVIDELKLKINQLQQSLPKKTVENGQTSQLQIVPFYDRSVLIKESLGTLEHALGLELLITVLVVLLMLFDLRASILVSSLLPLAILLVFVAMKSANISANIVALSGIAIAIGTMVDMGIILSENMIKHLNNQDFNHLNVKEKIYNATAEVSSAILTAVLTTIVSFIPVFALSGVEARLFDPLAFTKTFALIASLLLALFLFPPFAALLYKDKKKRNWTRFLSSILGILFSFYLFWMTYNEAIFLLIFSTLTLLEQLNIWNQHRLKQLKIATLSIVLLYFLTIYWQPLGYQHHFLTNLTFVALVCFGLLGIFTLFKRYYLHILTWALEHKALFLALPLALIVSGFLIMKSSKTEFMPTLDEGAFLLMPSTLPHAGVEESKRILKALDISISNIPEIELVVGKAGRVESALDPAPLSMYENIVQYKSEYIVDEKGLPIRFKVDENLRFISRSGEKIANPNLDSDVKHPPKTLKASTLIPDHQGEYYRNWRPEIETPDDIWNQIAKASALPGITAAPKLQPIETRILMLQTGVSAPMAIQLKGDNLETLEYFGSSLESLLKQTEGVDIQKVYAEKNIGKPYLNIELRRDQLQRYGLSVADVYRELDIAIGGQILTQSIDGRSRYNIRLRYPRELRSEPEALKQIYIPIEGNKTLPLSELADIVFQKGPQSIKSENGFLTTYVLFDKLDDYEELKLVSDLKNKINLAIENGEIILPNGVQFDFIGSYQNQLHAEKTLAFVIPIALLLIFLILYVQFRSLAISLMIFSGVAVAFSGGFLMLWLYGQDWFLNITLFGENLRELFHIQDIKLSIAVWVGFIALFGIATDDGVVMASYLKQHFDGKTLKTKAEIREKVIQAGLKRIRPCLMTSATTLLALLPVLTSSGKGSSIMIPMAIPSFGGMMLALISLFVVPILYSWKAELNLKKHEKNNS